MAGLPSRDGPLTPLPPKAAPCHLVSTMDEPAAHPTTPLHGITLERMLTEMVAELGWPRMGRRVKIACFLSDPSIKSSLTFLRRTPWARTKVEAMYLDLTRTARKRALARSATPVDTAP